MYYLIRIASGNYKSESELVYYSDLKLNKDQIVTVPLKDTEVIGLVSAKAPPHQATRKNIKPISRSVGAKPLPRQLASLLEWSRKYYPAPSSQYLQMMLPKFLANRSDIRKTTKRKPAYLTHSIMLKGDGPPLTKEQKEAIRLLGAADKPCMLHGVTGSGKTRVYIELAKKSLKLNKSVVVLTPEIGLTSQLAKQFSEFFSNVMVYHSNLTESERRTVWLQVLNSADPWIIIGPRSCLFLPLDQIGLIVIDEAHDSAYKQDQSPRYQTTRIAGKLAGIHKARLVMGSATPPISDYYIYKQKQLPIVNMKQVAAKHKAEVSVEVIDLKERSQFSKSPWLSLRLIEAIADKLQKKQQSILYLNRRGTARLVICANCGWQADCPRCDITLAYHSDLYSLRCHVCGFRSPVPALCPDCGKSDIEFRSIGTKSIVTEVQKLFPSAKVARFDTDNLKAEKLESLYSEVATGAIDILIGTKMLSKGLDLPKLTLVGVIIAESSLLLPDFSAEETEFQQLSQIRGRLGRSDLPGTMIVQSYQPGNELLRYALEQDYQSFYGREIKNREQYLYPPFCYLLVLTASRATKKGAQKAIKSTISYIASLNLPVIIVGPSEAYREKIRNQYRWQCIVKSKDRSYLMSIVSGLPNAISYDLDPISLL